MPPNGARCIFLRRIAGEENYERSVGRYIHAWNNMGRLVLDDGTVLVVSTCDMWVRVWTTEEEKTTALKSV
jgi:hypothetical protein